MASNRRAGTSDDRLKVRGRLMVGRSGVATTQTTLARDGGGGSTSRTHEYAVTAADAAAARAGETAPRPARSLAAAILSRYLQRGRSAGLGTSHRTRARRLSAGNRCSSVQRTRSPCSRGDTKLGRKSPLASRVSCPPRPTLGRRAPPTARRSSAHLPLAGSVRLSEPRCHWLSNFRQRGRWFAAGPPRLRAFDWRC